MKILVLGAGGFLGRRLAIALGAAGSLRGQPITAMTLADLAAPETVEAACPVATRALDITDPGAVAAIAAEGADVIYHLAAVVSGQAEAEFDIGMAVNLHGCLHVFEGARQSGRVPLLIFTSSIAVFGGAMPYPIPDATYLNPQTSYGTQKAAAELLLSDYSRKGFVDGRGLRLPTISVRPGKPNKAASSFFSSIFREPLQGEPANCPVDPDFEHWFLSPRRCIENLLHAAEIDAEAFGTDRCLTLNGRAHRIRDMVEAMRRVAGDAAVERITWERDPVIEAIVYSWPRRFEAEKAARLGFTADESFEDNLRFFLEDDIEPDSRRTAP